MKLLSLAVVGLWTTATALSIAQPDQTVLDNQDLYLIELNPGEVKWITEDEKWALRRVCRYPPPEETRPFHVQYRGC